MSAARRSPVPGDGMAAAVMAPGGLTGEPDARVPRLLEAVRSVGGDSAAGIRPRFVTAEHWRLYQLFPDEMSHATQAFTDLVLRQLEAARDQWHWVLGRNPNGYSMVTRVGKGPTRLYHEEWGHREPPVPGFLVGGPNAMEAGFLAPGAPAKALLWDNPHKLRSGTPAHGLWHWQQSDLWDGGFEAEESWDIGWWTVIEPDIYYNANFVLAAVAVR